MSDEMNPQPRSEWQPTRSMLRFGVFIGFAAGIGIGHRLSAELANWVVLASILAALFFYYRRDKA